jgi:glucitol operon activator protein
MLSWQWFLVAWAVLWALQSVGVWYQTTRYADQLKALQTEFTDGYIGTGHSPRRLGKGAIVMLILSSDMKVKRFMVMRGMTVLAKFMPVAEYEGMSLVELDDALAKLPKKSTLKKAAEKAIEQIQNVKKNRESTSVGGSALAHV